MRMLLSLALLLAAVVGREAPFSASIIAVAVPPLPSELVVPTAHAPAAPAEAAAEAEDGPPRQGTYPRTL